MEKLTLTPQCHELIVNNGALEGAVDLFSYGPDPAANLKPLGCLYVVGHRETDSNNMGYMVSLIAALARREYYAQSGLAPREAFSRTLKKVNEVVEEFFQSSGVDLSVGIFAIAGANIFVSKLDKFKVLLARDGQVIDIMNNVMLFQKEHLQKRQFSSIISGTVQPGDRLLAYYPSKAVTSRERFLKSYLLKMPYEEMAEKISEIGRQHAAFATALLYVDMAQTAEPAVSESPHGKLDTEAAEPEPMMPAMDEMPAANLARQDFAAQNSGGLAWKPRQARSPLAANQPKTAEAEPQLTASEPEPEVPHLIPTEFSLGIRASSFSRWMKRVRLVRLDTRGKALFLASAVVIVVIVALVARLLLFTSPEERQLKQALEEISNDLELAQQKVISQEPGSARQILVRALSALANYDQGHSTVRGLSASILRTMDDLDHAQDTAPSLIAQLDPNTDRLALVAWSSTSQSLWAVVSADSRYALAHVIDGTTLDRTELGDVRPSLLVPFKDSALIIDSEARQVTRAIGPLKTFAIPTQDTILDATEYGDNLYILTDRSILKVSDLDTDKPVTKQWLNDVNELATGALRIYVDGNIYLMGRDGMLTTYYKGKKSAQVQTSLEPSGNWDLIPVKNGHLAVANADTRRIYELDIATGTLTTTLKLDAQVALVQMTAGPDGSVLLVTKDNKIWKTN